MDAERAAEGLRTALALHDAGVEMMRLRLARKHPDADPDEVERRLCAWLRERPGAEHGDAEGRPVPWPRRPA